MLLPGRPDNYRDVTIELLKQTFQELSHSRAFGVENQLLVLFEAMLESSQARPLAFRRAVHVPACLFAQYRPDSAIWREVIVALARRSHPNVDQLIQARACLRALNSQRLSLNRARARNRARTRRRQTSARCRLGLVSIAHSFGELLPRLSRALTSVHDALVQTWLGRLV